MADDYQGFDIEPSKARSRQWIALDNVDRSRIGRKSYWEEHVVARLNDEATERWVRSAEARKELKLSTCDLAHMQDAGKIAARKVGNAYLYKLAAGIVSPKRDDERNE